MAQTIRPQSQDGHHFRPRRRSAFGIFLIRYQILELFLIIGGIVLAWLGASWGNVQL
jgi:hypothetical protein